MVHGDRNPTNSEAASDLPDHVRTYTEKPQLPVDAPDDAVDALPAQKSGLFRETGEYALELVDWKPNSSASSRTRSATIHSRHLKNGRRMRS